MTDCPLECRLTDFEYGLNFIGRSFVVEIHCAAVFEHEVKNFFGVVVQSIFFDFAQRRIKSTVVAQESYTSLDDFADTQRTRNFFLRNEDDISFFAESPRLTFSAGLEARRISSETFIETASLPDLSE